MTNSDKTILLSNRKGKGTHDIQDAAYICDRVIIFKDGQFVKVIRRSQKSLLPT
ncbi:hypothetical protein [Alkalihalobacillus sp. TS-13]|uniref:hypothetical protein n=1 Tax=Alkalihalobacillus sp. TS-13 TaxID=2842455 RepID=UPI001C879290|nr:hypothetical protein [Alkalihalobacillus sp. TS-13]